MLYEEYISIMSKKLNHEKTVLVHYSKMAEFLANFFFRKISNSIEISFIFH